MSVTTPSDAVVLPPWIDEEDGTVPCYYCIEHKSGTTCGMPSFDGCKLCTGIPNPARPRHLPASLLGTTVIVDGETFTIPDACPWCLGKQTTSTQVHVE